MKLNNYSKYDQDIYITTINGLKIVCIPSDKFKQTEVTLLVDYGATDITFKNNNKNIISGLGAAHFIEHKIFELQDGSDAFMKLSSLGADGNAYTTYDETAYMFSASSNIYESLEVFLNFIFTNTFNDETINKEKGIITEELMMYLDKPNYKVQEHLLKIMYKSSFIKDPILGTKESINNFDKESLSEIYESFYHPSNMVLNISGNIDVDELEKFLNKELDKYSFKEFNTKKIYPLEDSKVIYNLDEIEIESDVNYVALGIKLQPVVEDKLRKEVIIDAFNFMLFSKSTNKINDLVESEVLFNGYSYYSVLNRNYSFIEFIATSDKQDVLIEELRSMILNFVDNFIDEDLELFKKVSNSHFIYSLENLGDLCYEVTAGIRDDYDYFETSNIINSITKEDVVEFANTIKEENIAFVKSKNVNQN